MNVWRKSCRAVSSLTGRRCDLPEHAASSPHRHGRTEFTEVATEGQEHFRLRLVLDELATSHREPGPLSDRRAEQVRQAQRRHRAKRKAERLAVFQQYARGIAQA